MSLSKFFLESILTEIKLAASTLFQLFTTLSHTTAIGDDAESGDDMKVITSLSVLLRNRSLKKPWVFSS